MEPIRKSIVLAVALVVSNGCGPQPSFSPSTKAASPLEKISFRRGEVAVDSGSSLRVSGQRCQLLGLKESADPESRGKAVTFIQHWFESVASVSIVNRNEPLLTEDGSPVIWLEGKQNSRLSASSCLNEELVRAGLADVDEASWKDYTFTVPSAKHGRRTEDWKEVLNDARELYRHGLGKGVEDLENTWVMESSIISGEDAIGVKDGMETKGEWTIRGNRAAMVQWTLGNNTATGVKYPFHVTIDPERTPKRMDLRSLDPDLMEGKTWLAIYEIDGDTMRISISLDMKRRTEFPAEPRSDEWRFVMKRLKP
jgi:uncharacterized protein (TIGR03067 family)